jgi:hypothetical protein
LNLNFLSTHHPHHLQLSHTTIVVNPYHYHSNCSDLRERERVAKEEKRREERGGRGLYIDGRKGEQNERKRCGICLHLCVYLYTYCVVIVFEKCHHIDFFYISLFYLFIFCFIFIIYPLQ